MTASVATNQPFLKLLPKTALASELLEFTIDRQARNLTPKTLAWYEQSLAILRAYLESEGVQSLHDLAPSHLRRFLVNLSERGHNAGGVRNIYGAVKALCNWYAAEYADWPNPLNKVANPKNPLTLQEPVSLETVQAMVSTCLRRTFLGDRDKAVLLFLLDSGVRHAEMCALDVGDINLATGVVIVRCGKGRKPRVTIIGAKTRKALVGYLKHRPAITDAAPLWATEVGTRLSYDGLRQVIRRRAKQAGAPEPSLHSFRRAFALAMLRNGADVYSLQKMMGHADLIVLRRYLAQTETDLRAAHGAASPVDHLF